MKKDIEEVTLIGRAFPDSLMDNSGTFAGCNQSLEEDEAFQNFIKENHLESSRASLLAFGPENFMYWYGVLVPGKHDAVKGLLKFNLPASEVFESESNENVAYFDMPLPIEIPHFLDEADKEGIEYDRNLGNSDMPFILRSMNMETKKLTKILYLKSVEK